MKKLLAFSFCLLLSFSLLAQSKKTNFSHITLHTDKTVLNPALHPGETALLTARGVLANGTSVELKSEELVFSSKNKLTSGEAPVVQLQGNKVVPKEGGISTITAIYQSGNQTLTATAEVMVRPYFRDYHQTLVMKLMMGMEGQPVERLKNEPLFKKQHDVICTFEQALEVIRKTDNITNGIPKILYLVGWQKGGHDHQYPSWDEVNPRLKRAQDKTALESLRWLIREGRKYNTTVSLHINMVDAYQHSPLWEEYVKKDLIAKDQNGKLLVAGMQIEGDSMYHISYTREWEAGLGQKRIDKLIAMIPELKEGKTIHVDVFIARGEHETSLSPWHAKKENGGIDMYKEVETQRKIFKYWRERGFDVTGEGIFWAHPPGEGFTGLQPMSWWYPDDKQYQLEVPEKLSARGRTSRQDDGDFRFASSMQGEDIFLKDLNNLPGFLEHFCRSTLPWYYLSRLDRVGFVDETLYYSEGVKAGTENGHRIVRRGNFVLRDNDDLFVPVLWKTNEIMAYSDKGYTNRQWILPETWQNVKAVAIYEIGLNGKTLIEKRKPISNGKLELSLKEGGAVSIVPVLN